MPAERDAEMLLATILEGIGQPFYAVDGNWRIYLYNRDAARHFGRTAEQMIGTTIWENFPQDVDAERGRILRDAMARREIVRGETMSLVGRYVSYVMFPLGDGLGVVFRDVTDRRIAEKQRELAEDALRARSAELEAVLETIPTAVWFTTDPELRNVIGNRRATELLRMSREADLSSALNQPVHFTVFRDGEPLAPDDRPLHRAARGEVVANELLEIRFDDDERRMILMRAAPLRNSAGELQGARRGRSGRNRTAPPRESSEAARQRAQSPGQEHAGDRSVDRHPHLEGCRSGRARRLRAAAADPERRARPADRRELGRRPSRLRSPAPRCAPPTNGSASRARICACKPKSAVALSMALHELGTNALKYGALSVEQGSVAVRWSTSDDRFRLRWEERGGPPVSPPTHRGFGSRMIERGLAAELRGEARIDWRPEGVVCTIDAPLVAIHEKA